jgi:hypothetical protein
MKITNAKLAVAGAGLAVAFLSGVALAPSLVSTAFAQVGPSDQQAVVERGPHPGGDLFKAAADHIGITVDQLRTKMGTDKSMADVAVAHGKTRDGLIAALTAAAAKDIATLVDHKGFPQPPFGRPGPALGVHVRVDLIQTTATYLGISVADLRTQLRSGKTLAAVAAATAGKTKDGLIAAIVAAETAQIDKAVADGKLTADQAAKIKSGLTERVTAMVEHKGPAGAPGFGSGFGPGFGPRGGRP